MMAGLFLLMTIVIALFYWKKRVWGGILLLITLALCWGMLWYHATDVLQINW